MKHWSEGKAAVVAIATSAAALSATFAFAHVMRTSGLADKLSSRATSGPTTVLPTTLTAEASEGRHLFLMNCAHCHGDDARGDEGPDLHALRKSDARIHQVITAGIKGEMPSFGKKLDEDDVRALTAFLRTLG
jgi:mono/diheme cytochrome c family protein